MTKETIDKYDWIVTTSSKNHTYTKYKQGSNLPVGVIAYVRGGMNLPYLRINTAASFFTEKCSRISLKRSPDKIPTFFFES